MVEVDRYILADLLLLYNNNISATFKKVVIFSKFLVKNLHILEKECIFAKK